MFKSYDYIANEDCTMLMLGTFPGEESRRVKEFYGNKRNQFWKLIFEVFDVPFNNDIKYSEKKKCLLNHNLALWDIIDECETDGSLDSKIKNPIFNDIQSLLDKYPKITRIFCNGGQVYKYLKKQNLTVTDITILPSSSPTNTMKYDDKLKSWKEVILC